MREVDLLRAGEVEQEVERTFPAVEAQRQLVGLSDRALFEILFHAPIYHEWWLCEGAATRRLWISSGEREKHVARGDGFREIGAVRLARLRSPSPGRAAPRPLR